jgi:hypothetical protein
MRKAAMGLVLAMACGIGMRAEEPAEKETKEELGCEMKLTNGSLIKGKLKGLGEIHMKTRHGILRFKVKDVRGVQWGNVKKEEMDTVTAVDGSFKGWIEDLEPFQVDTGFGMLKIPTTAVKQMRVIQAGKALGSDFEMDSLDEWTKFGGSGWVVTDGKLVGTPTGNYDCIQYNEVMEGAYTIEVDITGANNAGILWNAQDGNNATALWMSPGSVRVFGGGTWYNNQIAYWNTQYAWNGTVHVKIEVDGAKATIWIGETKVGEASSGNGTGKVGFFCFNQVTSFDNLVITR